MFMHAVQVRGVPPGPNHGPFTAKPSSYHVHSTLHSHRSPLFMPWWCHTDVWHRQCRPGEHNKWCPSHSQTNRQKKWRGFHSLALALTPTNTIYISSNHLVMSHCWWMPALYCLMSTTLMHLPPYATVSTMGQMTDISMMSSGHEARWRKWTPMCTAPCMWPHPPPLSANAEPAH